MYKRLYCKKIVGTCFGNSSPYFSTKIDISKILATQLGLNDDTIKNIQGKTNILQLSENRLVQNCSILKKLTVDIQNVTFLVDCLSLEPKVINNRILLLQEMGVESVTLDNIFKFPLSMRQSIRTFKKNHKLPPEHDIIKSMFNSVGMSEAPTFSNLPGRANTSDYYIHAVTYYKTVHLKLYHKSLITHHRFKYQSFREIFDLLNIFENEFQFDKDFLNRHPYLLQLSMDEVNNFIKRFKDVKIAGADILVILRKYPRILMTNLDNLDELLSLFVEYNVPDCTVFTNLQILTMKKDTFVERYRTVSNHPHLCVWLKHSRILYTIIAYKLVMERLRTLELMDYINFVSFYSLYSTRKHFLRTHGQGRHPRVARKKYLTHIFNREFGPEQKCIIEYITRHPHWKVVPFSCVYKMIIYLKEHFSKEDIIANLHIVLYPQNAVDRMLQVIDEKFSPEEGYNFTARQRLALCLYLLEKSHHFTGDAVWQIMHSNENEVSTTDVLEDLDEVKHEHLDESVNNVTTNETDYIGNFA